MSKIGKLPIKLPTGVNVEVNGQSVKITGPKGSLVRELPRGFEVEKNEENEIILISKRKSQDAIALHGTNRALLANMVKGVSEGWKKVMELVGTGYRAETNGKTLTLTIGFSHPVKVEAPENISFKVEKSIVTIEGIDREIVGQIAANIRFIRPPEPYKGKGIKYVDEVIRRKAGKAAKTAAA